MRELHPDVRAGLSLARELRHRIADMRERADAIVARRPSPSGLVIPEVDARGRLRDLYLAPGTCARFDSQELAAEIVAAITESTADARRQYQIAMNDPANLPRPLSEVMREWRAGPDREPPNFGKPEQ
ncbi:YbaB/EbfC family nucleoid-associated protein [Nocardia sp. NPDC049707]|uniref:YbaB/EbfC family nucleoid-associated protein n=1 Tax=Nocardia sp. NPDC049707 TaxID=3154735 RepID=UPI003435196C